MKIILILIIVVAFASSLPSVLADAQDKSLGDVAREQPQIKKQPSKKRYTNDDIAASPVSPAAQSAGSESKPPISPQPQDAVVSIEEKEKVTGTARRALDRPREPETDTIVVPTGTQMKANIYAEEVTLPVTVGETTVIPVAAKVKVRLQTVHFMPDAPDLNSPLVSYGADATMVELVSITVEGKAYDLHTNSVNLAIAQAQHTKEMVFTLQKPLSVTRPRVSE